MKIIPHDLIMVTNVKFPTIILIELIMEREKCMITLMVFFQINISKILKMIKKESLISIRKRAFIFKSFSNKWRFYRIITLNTQVN